MLIIACGILGIALLFIRLLDYGSARSASLAFLKRNPKAAVVGSYRIRSVVFFSLALFWLFLLIFLSKESTNENKALLVLLSMIMLSEVVNSLSNHRVYIGDKEVLIKDKVVAFKRMKEVSKKGLFGTFKITLFNNDTIIAPNTCFKQVCSGAKLRKAPK